MESQANHDAADYRHWSQEGAGADQNRDGHPADGAHANGGEEALAGSGLTYRQVRGLVSAWGF